MTQFSKSAYSIQIAIKRPSTKNVKVTKAITTQKVPDNQRKNNLQTMQNILRPG